MEDHCHPCPTWTSLSSKSGGSCLACLLLLGRRWVWLGGSAAPPEGQALGQGALPKEGRGPGWGRGMTGGCAQVQGTQGSEASAPGPEAAGSVMWPGWLCELPAAAENRQVGGLMDRWTWVSTCEAHSPLIAVRWAQSAIVHGRRTLWLRGTVLCRTA